MDTSIADLDPLPSQEGISRTINTILFLQLSDSKLYHARTRAFLATFGPVDEEIIVSILKRPDEVLKEAQEQADKTARSHETQRKTLRMVGMGLGAIAGGVLVGVTGGLAAPFVGASVATVFGWLGIGGTAAGLIASGLAGSSVLCGALFGAYGARTTARMVERHTQEVKDLAIVPVTQMDCDDRLAVRLCVSGWLSSPADIVEPWTIFDDTCDVLALSWVWASYSPIDASLNIFSGG
jgi:hypothetical protein